MIGEYPQAGTCVKYFDGIYSKVGCSTNQIREKYYSDVNCQTFLAENVYGKSCQKNFF